MLKIPLIDLAPLRSGSDAEIHALSQEIIAAAEKHGFFYIINHGVPPEIVERAYAQSKAFFDQDMSDKELLSNRYTPNMRGYVGFREETPEDSMIGDNKEGFDMAAELPADDPLSQVRPWLYGANVWPRDLPGFRATMMEYYGHQMDLARQLLGCFAIGLDLPRDYFARFITNPLAQLRILHYPPTATPSAPESMGCGAHTDYGTMTILSQSVEGLEVMDGKGGWIVANNIPGTFIVNIGDLMARWTNDRLFANTHRVINRQFFDRYSIAFFIDPDYDAEISCIPSCLREGETPLYPPVVFGPYNESKLNATFTFRKTNE